MSVVSTLFTEIYEFSKGPLLGFQNQFFKNNILLLLLFFLKMVLISRDMKRYKYDLDKMVNNSIV